MLKYKVKLTVGFCGMEGIDFIEAETEEEAHEIAFELALSHAATYGFEPDEEWFGDEEQVGRGWISEEEGYAESGTAAYGLQLLN